VVVLEALELALFALARWHCKGSKAHNEGSYSQNIGGKVVRSRFTDLAPLGLNSYSRDRGGEGWDGRGGAFRREVRSKF